MPGFAERLVFLFSIGNSAPLAGTSDGDFSQPEGVAVDSSGNLYVADYGNNRVQIFDSSGNYKDQTTAVISGTPFVPVDVAVDSSGNIYAVDNEYSIIVKFDSSLAVVNSLGSFGTGNYQFNGPTGVAVDPSGDYVYVVDNGNNRLMKFDSSLSLTSYVTQWGASAPTYAPGSGDGQFKSPTSVAVDNSGHVYVIDSGNDRVQKFRSSGDYRIKWGLPGSSDGQFKQPLGVAVFDPSIPGLGNDVVVTDSVNNRVQRFSDSGGYWSQWGSPGGLPGSGDNQFSQPYGVAVYGARVYVADSLNNRVQAFIYEISPDNPSRP